VLLIALALASPFSAPAAGQVSGGPDTVIVQSGALRLRGLLWRPLGRGPFPAVLFNHGGGQTRATASDEHHRARGAAELGPVFARHGYVLLFLFRRGSGLSAGQGTYSGDLRERELATRGQEAHDRLQVQLLESDELNDALAGLAFLRALPEVDARRVALAGHSFGGSLTLLVAERDSTLRAAVDFAGAAGSWRSPPLRARLLRAVARTVVPVFLVHAANDYSVAPGEVLAAEMARLGKPHRVKIYPPFGPTADDGHSFVYLSITTWEPDVFAFLDEHMRR
jgi:carboxymethylenebutenolidase